MAAGVVNILHNWDQIVANPEAPASVTVTLAVFPTALFLFLTLLVSRGRIGAAKWALLVFAALGVLTFVPLPEFGAIASVTALNITISALRVVGVALLFTPSARAWLRSDARLSAGALEQTFE
jgi:hypothetical protein